MAFGPDVLDKPTKLDAENVKKIISDIDDKLANYVKSDKPEKIVQFYLAGDYTKPNYLVQTMVRDEFLSQNWLSLEFKYEENEDSHWNIRVILKRKIGEGELDGNAAPKRKRQKRTAAN